MGKGKKGTKMSLAEFTEDTVAADPLALPTAPRDGTVRAAPLHSHTHPHERTRARQPRVLAAAPIFSRTRMHAKHPSTHTTPFYRLRVGSHPLLFLPQTRSGEDDFRGGGWRAPRPRRRPLRPRAADVRE